MQEEVENKGKIEQKKVRKNGVLKQQKEEIKIKEFLRSGQC